MKHQARRPGFALIESLVAITLLSAGLAGSAALLVQTLRQQHAATYRAIALRQAVSLADALRVLRRADGRPLQAVTSPGAMPACAPAPDDCMLERSARRQIDDWQAATAALLPTGSMAQVTLLPISPIAYLVRLTWRVPGESAAAALQLVVEP